MQFISRKILLRNFNLKCDRRYNVVWGGRRGSDVVDTTFKTSSRGWTDRNSGEVAGNEKENEKGKKTNFVITFDGRGARWVGSWNRIRGEWRDMGRCYGDTNCEQFLADIGTEKLISKSSDELSDRAEFGL